MERKSGRCSGRLSWGNLYRSCSHVDRQAVPRADCATASKSRKGKVYAKSPGAQVLQWWQESREGGREGPRVRCPGASMMARVKGRGKGGSTCTLDESLSSRTIHIRIWGAGYLAPGMSLVVQWLKISTPNAGGPCLIPGQGTSSHMPQLKIPHNAMKTRHSWINKSIFFLSTSSQAPPWICWIDISGGEAQEPTF